MALPALLGVMLVGQLVQTGVGLYEQSKMQDQAEQALKMQQSYLQQQSQSMGAFMGGGIPGQYPGLA